MHIVKCGKGTESYYAIYKKQKDSMMADNCAMRARVRQQSAKCGKLLQQRGGGDAHSCFGVLKNLWHFILNSNQPYIPSHTHIAKSFALFTIYILLSFYFCLSFCAIYSFIIIFTFVWQNSCKGKRA